MASNRHHPSTAAKARRLPVSSTASSNKRHRPQSSAVEKEVEHAPWDDEQGHYGIELGSNLTPQYKILKLLGQGTFGKVVECWDRQTYTRVAVKIIRAVEKYREAAKKEVCILNTLLQNDRNNSKHIQHFALQLMQSIQFVHSLNIIHTDLKPENILLVNSDSREPASGIRTRSKRKASSGDRILLQSDIRLIDFGSAIVDTERHSSIVSTRHYRAPEVILGLGWSFPCDMYVIKPLLSTLIFRWSLGCIFVEFLTGEALFQTHDNLEHLAIMEKILGPIPDHLIEQVIQRKQGAHYFFSSSSAAASRKTSCKYHLLFPVPTVPKSSQKFVASVEPLEQIILSKASALHQSRNTKQKTRSRSSSTTEQTSGNEFLTLFLDLIRKCLTYDPCARITASEALCHPFFAYSVLND